jgi:protease IV
VTTTPLSGQPDLLRGPSPEASQLLQMGVDGTYRRFIMLVARARHLPPARVNEIAQGRVWDGGTAHQLGLVDRFGNLGDAVAEAARRAHLDPADVRPVFLEREPGWLARIFSDAARGDDNDRGDAAVAPRDAFAGIARRPETMLARALNDARELLTGPAIQARCLECGADAPAPPTEIADSLWARLLALVWRG